MALECVPVDLANSLGFASFTQTSYLNVDNMQLPSEWIWNQAVASLSEDWVGFSVTNSSNSGRVQVVVIAVGTAGNEQIIATLPLGPGTDRQKPVFVPVTIPAGSRVSVACTQSVQRLQLQGYPKSKFPNLKSYSFFESGPFDWLTASVPNGVEVTPGLNTKGSWTELSITGGKNDFNLVNGNSLSHVYDFVSFSGFGGSTATVNWMVDIGIGPAGFEEIVVSNLAIQASGFDAGLMDTWIPWGYPAGTRVAVRAQASVVTLLQGVMLSGVR